GVENFQNDVVNNWNTSWTPSTKTFTALPGFTYSVVALPNDANSGYFRATAYGPESATNIVVASVSRSVIPSTAPGALHLANAGATNCTFNGNGFIINGNDENYTGGDGPGAPVPGLSSLNDTNTQEAINSLNNQEKHDVTGLGFSSDPLIPSVWGSLWTTDINMVVGGAAFIQYSTQALALANEVSGGRALPSKLVINSMVDCAAVPAGTNQCPAS